jgi:hypothetical protein
MADDNLTADEVRKLAAEIGLTRLTDEHLQQLVRATKIARARRATLPVASLVPADEPAHVFDPSPPSPLPIGEGGNSPPLSRRERGRG